MRSTPQRQSVALRCEPNKRKLSFVNPRPAQGLNRWHCHRFRCLTGVNVNPCQHRAPSGPQLMALPSIPLIQRRGDMIDDDDNFTLIKLDDDLATEALTRLSRNLPPGLRIGRPLP